MLCYFAVTLVVIVMTAPIWGFVLVACLLGRDMRRLALARAAHNRAFGL